MILFAFHNRSWCISTLAFRVNPMRSVTHCLRVQAASNTAASRSLPDGRCQAPCKQLINTDRLPPSSPPTAARGSRINIPLHWSLEDARLNVEARRLRQFLSQRTVLSVQRRARPTVAVVRSAAQRTTVPISLFQHDVTAGVCSNDDDVPASSKWS